MIKKIMEKIPIKANCIKCGVEFIQINKQNTYCTRACYKHFYNQRYKKNNNEVHIYPLYRCKGCGELFQLTFDPIKEEKKNGKCLEMAKCNNCKELKQSSDKMVITKG